VFSDTPISGGLHGYAQRTQNLSPTLMEQRTLQSVSLAFELLLPLSNLVILPQNRLDSRFNWFRFWVRIKAPDLHLALPLALGLPKTYKEPIGQPSCSEGEYLHHMH
jgi:hypothetical protein